MIKHAFALITAFALLGCDKVLIKPRLTQNKITAAEENSVIVLERVAPTPQIIKKENQSEFKRMVKTVDSSSSRLTLKNYLEHTREKLPIPSSGWNYKVGVGDTIKVRRPAHALINLKNAVMEPFFDDVATVDELGQIILSDGLRLSVVAKTASQIREEVDIRLSEINSTSKRKINFLEFPIIKSEIYTVGPGDRLLLGRKVSVINPINQSMQEQDTSLPLLVDEFGKVQISDLEGEIYVDGLLVSEIREVLRREYLRAGLSKDISLQMQDYASKTVIVTGDFGSVISSISPFANSFDSLLVRVLSGSKDAGIVSNPSLSEILVTLDRDGQLYYMLASSILIDQPREKYLLKDGDRIVLSQIEPVSKSQVEVVDFKSQSVVLVQYGDVGSRSMDIEGDEEIESKSSRLYLDQRGLRVRELIADHNLWPDAGSDTMITLRRGESKFRWSVNKLIADNSGREYYLQNGDVIQVENLILADNKYFVVGETGKPIAKNVALLDREFLTDAIFSSNLFENSKADLRHVYLVRNSGNEKFKAFHFDLSDVTKLDLARRMEMRPNDIVLVETQPIYEYNLFTSLIFGIFNNPIVAGLSSE